MSLPGVRKAVSRVHPYVGGKTVEEVRRELGLDHVVKLGSNENPYGPYPAAFEAMRDALSRINSYPEATFVELKRVIAGLYGFGPENIAIAHGAGGMLETLARTFLEKDDEVVMPRQTYGLYREISRLMGAEVREFDLGEAYTVDLDRAFELITGKTKLFWLCNPNNPTGTVFDARRFDELLDAMPATGWIVLDEAYAEFAAESLLPDGREAIRRGGRVVVVRTFSKAYGLAGARLGYALASPEMIRTIDTVAEPFNANRIGIAGARATLERDGASYSEALEAILAERARLEVEIGEMNCAVVPTQTNFLFFALPENLGVDAASVAQALLRRGVIVRSAAGWGYPRHLRVTVGTPEENQFFLEQLREALADG
ncbi:MAG: histidinol-phosphate transaminase [Spirochaetaceae bacterium]